MKYNVGDKVKIKSLDWYNANKDAEGSIRIGKQELFLKEMVHLLGGVYTIKHACNNSYKLEGDEENWYVADYMLEDEVVSDIPSESLIYAEPDKYDYCEHNELSTVMSLIDEGWYLYHHDSTRCYLRREKTSPKNAGKFEVGDMVCIRTDLNNEYKVDSICKNGYRLMNVDYDRLLPKLYCEAELISTVDWCKENLSTNFHLDEETMKLTPEVKDKVEDMINRPPHYTNGKVECIDAMIAAFGEEEVAIFCKINAFKYLWRCNNKNGKEDIEKGGWYINKNLELT